ncbi:hypothetical protein SAMN05421670_2394 [Psychrobacillus psychrotolerans]|uniref:Uncharacterized protein n=1 Tax=Psychrobacillus psychrotolerans TaxID=126156 RepID=A0A1I5Z5R6_9BACI|nr:hypothetical protein [Psychrobacillus psychrotolerans]SFQ51457.1 hypothetical protein SAMN05421670_2394 [Psychrobacillus psychrotolerans]
MKKFKIFLIVALVVILVGGGYLLYMFKFKEYDVADEEVTEIVSEPYKVELPDGSTILIDENGEIIEETTEGNKITTSSANTNSNGGTTNGSTNSSNGQTSDQSTGSSGNTNNSSSNNTSSGNNKNTGSNAGNNNTNAPTTVASIKDKYRPSFEGLEAQADSKINALIGRAMSEYSTNKANGEGVDFGYFYNKYMSAANGLEANTDTIFNAVIGAVEKDLAANGYDKSYAQSFRDEYEATKKARRDSILSKALNR